MASVNPMQGKHHTKESKIKISKKLLGITRSNEFCRKVSESKKGHITSTETRNKISESKKGYLTSPETKAKQSKTIKRLYAEGKIVHPNKGKHRSEETKRKLSVFHTNAWNSLSIEEKDSHIKKTLEAQKMRPTKPERDLNTLLQINFPNEWKYVGDGQVIIGYHNPDFINNNGKKQLIEVFGDYWHYTRKLNKNPNYTRKQEEDKFKERYKRFGNFETLVIWEHELKDENAIIEKIRNFNN